jgi:hypothetical protein
MAEAQAVVTVRVPDRPMGGTLRRTRPSSCRPVAIVLGALAASRLLYWQRGLRFDVGFVDASMQVADLDLLKSAPFSTAWFLHIQPPLFNLFVGLGANLFGSFAGLGFQVVYLLATVAMLVAFVRFCLDLGVRAGVATVLGAFLAVSPTVAQYESLLFYTHLELVLLVLAARGLQRWCLDRSTNGIIGFSAALCALALGRSLYHPAWFAGLLVLLLVVARGPSLRRPLAVAVCLPLQCGVAVGTKNAAVFGWWTTGSLEGINLHRITEPYLTDAERTALVRDGTITETSTEAFSCRRSGELYPPSGPVRAVPVLDRRWREADQREANLNYRNNVACLKALRVESLRVLARAPDAYLRALSQAVPIALLSAVPDVRTRDGNQAALAGPGRVEAAVLGSVEPGPDPFDPSYGDLHATSTQWVLALGALVVPVYLAWLLVRRTRAGNPDGDAPVLAFALFVALTGVVLTQLTEVGENNRLMLVSWPMLLAGAGLLVSSIGPSGRRPVPHVTDATR